MPLSRLQLAAALLEYDNDEADPADRRDHRKSAVFADVVRRQEARRASQLTTIPPTQVEREVASWGSVRPGGARDAASSASLRPDTARDHTNPTYGSSPVYVGDYRSARASLYGPSPIGERDLGEWPGSVEQVADVDVSRWGLPDHLLSPDVDRAASAASAPLEPRARPLSMAAVPELRERAQSFHADRAAPDPDRLRRASMDADAMARHAASRRSPERPAPQRRRSMIADLVLVDDYARDRKRSNPVMVPLPSSPPATSRRLSRLSAHSYGPSDMYLDEPDAAGDEEAEPNPFALPAPPPELGSRFDPKSMGGPRRASLEGFADIRPSSRGSMLTVRSSFDAHQQSRALSTYDDSADDARRRIDSGSSGASGFELVRQPTAYDEVPTAEEYGRPLRPSKYGRRQFLDRHTLLRPKTLVMPSPLAGTESTSQTVHVPDGFLYGDKPLPAGARSSILSMGRKVGEIGGQGGVKMSLSQKTFRSSLMVDGTRDEGFVGQAEEGHVVYDDEEDREERRPGKLYGTSLIDQLEARKTEMRGKQRVFTGDSRPSMMQRPSNRSSTLIDPATLHDPPSTAPAASPQTSPKRPGSMAAPTRDSVFPTDARMIKSRSVFGVDHLWEREMDKLKVIQDAEARSRAAREEREREAQAKADARAKRGRMSMIFPASKSRVSVLEAGVPESHDEYGADAQPGVQPSQPEVSPVARIPDLPPALHYLPETAIPSTRGIADKINGQRRTASRAGLNWDDSDDEEPVRRDKGKGKAKAALPEPARAYSDSDDEDVPLSRLRPVIAVRQPDEDSDSDEPLSTIKARSVQSPRSGSGSASPALALPDPTFGLGSLGLDLAPSPRSVSAPVKASANNDADDDDDDEPLYKRQARVRAASHAAGKSTSPASPLSAADEAEDDLPLGWKHVHAAQRQHAEAAQQQAEAVWLEGQRAVSMMGYGAPWGMPPPGTMPGMGMMSGIPMMGPPGMPPIGHVGMPPLPHMPSMASLPGAPFGVPFPPMPELGPGKNIDDWRKGVALVPATTGSGHTVSSGGR
ncbi:hypothetical protein Q5752_001899 [Cryptotrichosporon argae]